MSWVSSLSRGIAPWVWSVIENEGPPSRGRCRITSWFEMVARVFLVIVGVRRSVVSLVGFMLVVLFVLLFSFIS